jgi:Carboxypeptidase regulatory-like domain
MSRVARCSRPLGCAVWYRVRALAWLVVAVACWTHAAGAQGGGSISGTVTAAQSGTSLSYAIVSIPARSVDRFTDAQGRFTLAALPRGVYDVIVKRIGFVPYRGQVVVEDGVMTTMNVQLVQIPYRLPTLMVNAVTECRRPGRPNRDADPDVAALVDIVIENADRYRLLAAQYPYSYRQLRAVGELADSGVFLQRVDTIVIRSESRATYQPGNVVRRMTNTRTGTSEYTMAIPSILDLADDTFAKNHCFAFGGTSSHDGETWVRLDVRAAARLRTPDVNGSFYLDSATAQLRRSDLQLTRVDRLPPPLRGVDGVDLATTYSDIADALYVIDRVCALNRLKRNVSRATPIELQRLMQYDFAAPPPGMLTTGVRAVPQDWVAGVLLPRNAVWCTP